MGTIFTFYSYKGGVGRTHLLANMAAYLCYYCGRKVLMLDWDLEAPGLHFYYGKTNQTIESKGLLDLFNDHNTMVRQAEKDVISEEDFIKPDAEYITPLITAENGGKIDLMPAIDYREESFHTRVDAFDWLTFYDELLGGNYLLWLKDQLKQDYDYVLIDSRTGFNDYSGICNVLMPDMNIILVAPNQQNFEGAKEMADRIVNAKYTQDKKRKPFILPILSKVDLYYGKEGDRWKKRFAKTFAFVTTLFDEDLKAFDDNILEIISAHTVLTYNADFALGEEIHFEPEAERLGEDSYLKHFENIALDFMEEMHLHKEININKVMASSLEAFYKENIKRNADDYESWYGLGKLYYDAEKLTEAAKAYEKVIEISPNEYVAWIGKGLIKYDLNQVEEAIQDFEKATKIEPNDSKLWLVLGLSHLDLKHTEKAIKAFEKAIEIDPTNFEAWFQLGKIYAVLEYTEKAIKAFEKAIEIDSTIPEAWVLLGSSYYISHQNDKGEKTLKQAIELAPDNYNAWYMFGLTQMDLQKYEYAIHLLQKALEIKADDHNAWSKLGVAQGMVKKYEDSINSLQKAIHIKADDQSVWYNLGVAYRGLQKYKEAINAYQNSIEVDPNTHESWYALGISYKDLGQFEEAIEALKKATEIKSDYYQAWNKLGSIYEKSGELNSALELYQKAYKANPNEKIFLHHIGWLHFTQGQWKKAKPYFQQYEEDSNSLMNLGHITLKETSQEAALKLYTQSLHKFEDKEEFFEGMEGDYQYLEKQGIARETFDQVLEELRAIQAKNEEAEDKKTGKE